MVYHQDLVRKQLTHSVLQHEAQGTQIGAPSVRMIVSDELHLVSHRQLEVEFLQFVVHQCREHGIYHSCSVIFDDRADLPGKITEFLEQRQLITPPVIDKENFKFVSSIVHNYVFNACLLCLRAHPSDKVLLRMPDLPQVPPGFPEPPHNRLGVRRPAPCRTYSPRISAHRGYAL